MRRAWQVIRRDPVVLFAVLTLIAIALAGSVEAVTRYRWEHRARERPVPRAFELIEPQASFPARPPRGMSVGRDGFGTIVSAPPRTPVPSQVDQGLGEPAPVGAPPPVAQQVAKYIRMFARLAPMRVIDQPRSARTRVIDDIERRPAFGTIILRDGCLRLAGPGEPHVVLLEGSRLYVDDKGYLTIGVTVNGTATDSRVAEPAWWNGGGRLPIERRSVARLRATCGPGAVTVVGIAKGVKASQVETDASAARQLVRRYGLGWTASLAAARRCRARLAQDVGVDPHLMIVNPCGSTPPLPVFDARLCPVGSRPRGGVCRTSEEYERPIPTF